MYYESGAKYFWISFATSLVVSAIVSFIFIMFVSPYITTKKTKVEVPNLKGMLQEQASLVLKNKGLLMLVSGKRQDANYEDGVVLEQEPLPGFLADKGSLVKIVINSKPQVAVSNEAVPDVRGLQLMAAKDMIEKSGYILGKIEFKESDTYAKDQVITMDPPPGSKSSKGTVVNIVVSAGVEMVTVPNIKRKTLSSARYLLKKTGLKLGSVGYTTNIELPFDIIVSQEPKAGAKVNAGSSVNVVVNHESNY